MNDSQKLSLALCCLIINIFIGQVTGLFSIFSALVFIPIASILILRTSFKLIYRVLFVLTGLILNDFLQRLFGINLYDNVASGIVTLFFAISLILFSIIIFIELKLTQKLKINTVLILTFLPLVSGSLYLYYFTTLGLINPISESETKTISKEEGLFKGNLSFSDTSVFYQNDSIYFVDGWAEKQMQLNHAGLFRKTEEADELKYIINIRHNLGRPYNHDTYYKINSTDSNGATPLDSVIQFTRPKSDSAFTIYIFSLKGSISHDTIIKEIRVTRKKS